MRKNPIYFVVILTLLNSFVYLFSFIIVDSARDLSKAIAIANFSDFPALGPDIGGFAHVGPAWFYFLALPAFTHSIIIVALWVGLFASLKLIFAYKLGSQMLDKKFALLWVCALFLPGWHTIDSFVLLHTNLVQSLTLLYFLMLYNFHQKQNVKYFFASLLVLSLAIHAHPTSLLLGMVLPFSIYKERNIVTFKVILLAGVIFLLPFFPYLINQIIDGFPDVQRFSHKVNNVNHLNIFQRLPSLISSLFYYGPLKIRNFIYSYNSILANLFLGFYLTVLLLSLIGNSLFCLKSRSNLLKTMKIFSSFLVFCLFLLKLRAFIPFYMILVTVPVTSGMLAFGLWQLFQQLKTRAYFFSTAIFFLIGILPNIVLIQFHKNQQFEIPNSNAIEHKVSMSEKPHSHGLDGVTMLSIADTNNFVLCHNISIHGPFTIVLDYTSAMIVNFFCPDATIKLGGDLSIQQKHLFIMHKSFWNKIEQEPEAWLYSSFGYTTKFNNHSRATAWEIAPFDDYQHPQRLGLKRNPKKNYEYTFSTQAHSKIIITNILPLYLRIKIEKILINNDEQKAELLMENLGNTMYSCKNCTQNSTIQWKIVISADDENSIDINEISQTSI